MAMHRKQYRVLAVALWALWFASLGVGVIQGAAVNSRQLGPSSRNTPLIISEILYHPGPASGPDAEFVELYNTDPVGIDLTGYRIGGDVQFAFPADTLIPPHGYLVVAANPPLLQSLRGLTGVLGPWAGSLPNAGGTVTLHNRRGAILLRVPYGDRPPWPGTSDGLGHSLVLGSPDLGESNPSAWRPSAEIGGNPGGPDPEVEESAAGVRLNEVAFHPVADPSDFIELYNYSARAADLSGCWIVAGPLGAGFRIPDGTILLPHARLVVRQLVLPFLMASAPAPLSLVSSNQTRVIDAQWLEPADGTGLGVQGRFPDGVGEFRALPAPSPEAPNPHPAPAPVVINEVMFHPASGLPGDEFIELFNRSGETVSLGGWRLTGGVSFTLPAGTAIPAGGFLVIAKDRAALLSRDPGLDSAQVVGDFVGGLSDQGEALRLVRPAASGSGWVTVSAVHYGDTQSWGLWTDGGGSSLELVDPESDPTMAMNWAGSDETVSGPWTRLEATGVVDQTSVPNARRLFVWLQGAGEVLLDDLEVSLKGSTNLVQNPGLEADATGWAAWGNHAASGREPGAGVGGGAAYHLRAQAGGKIVGDKLIVTLTGPVPAGAIVSIRAKARWLAGDPNLVFILKGSGFELAGHPLVPAPHGTPGRPNSRLHPGAPPALSELVHFPALPAAGETVTVAVRADPPAAGGGGITLVWSLDGAAEVNRVAMHDDGLGEDLHPGDGIYSGTIPGAPAGTMVAYTVEGLSGPAGSVPSRLPVADPHYRQQGLVRFGDPIQGGDFGSCHIWMRAADAKAWDAEPNDCNQLWPATIVCSDHRVIHGAGIRFRGSTFSRPSFGDPIAGPPAGYVVRLPDSDRFLGSTALNFDRMENDSGTWQRTRLTMELGRAVDAPAYHIRYVHLFMNGNRRAQVYSDAQLPDGDYLASQFPGQGGGYLHESVKYSEFSDTIVNEGNERLGPFSYFVKTAGVMRKNIYRTLWERKASGPADDSYRSLFTLYEAMNAPVDASQVAAFEALVDAEDFMRTLVMRHLSEDQDGFGYDDMANGMIYKPLAGRWRHVPWDFDTGWGVSRTFTDPLPPLLEMQSTDLKFASFFTRPGVQRAYWRAVRQGATWLGSVGPGYIAAWNSVLQAPQNLGLPMGDYPALKAEVVGRARFAQLMFTNANLMVPFAVTNLPAPVAGVVTVTNRILTIAGTAPVTFRTLHINGVEAPAAVRWLDVRRWQLRVGLHPGLNHLEISGRAPDGTQLGTLPLDVEYDGPGVTPAGHVILNEVMVRPAAPRAAYVEIRNLHPTEDFDLGGVRIQGVGEEFPPGTILPAGGYLLAVEDAAAWADAYGLGAMAAVAGEFAGSLSLTGDTLRLLLADGVTVIDSMSYGAADPWARPAWDGSGQSFQLVDPSRDHHQPWNWRAATATPGAANPFPDGLPPLASLVITEVQPLNASTLPDDSGRFGPWVELLNTGSAVSLDGCYLTDDLDAPTRWALPAASVIESGGRLLIWCDGDPAGLSAPGHLHAPFRLPSAHGSIALYQVAGGLTNLISFAGYDTPPVDRSVGRFPETWDSPVLLLDAPTPGAANDLAPPGTIRINEWMASNRKTLPNPANGQFDDWIELVNIGARWADLGSYGLSDNLTNTHPWRFPPLTLLPPGGHLLVWADNAAALGGLHADFKLDAAGEEIVLFLPDGRVGDHVTFGPQSADLSEGRFPEGGDLVERFVVPTPGYANGTAGPLIDLQDAAVLEGDAGLTLLRFPVTLSAASSLPVTVGYATRNLTAIAGPDYLERSGEITFAPGVMSMEVEVPVVGDMVFEPGGEQFLLWVTSTAGGTARRSVAIGSILEDDSVAPVVENAAGAMEVVSTAAIARGRLISAGGLPSELRFYWGMADGLEVGAAWENVTSLGVVPEGAHTASLTGLVPDTTYFYRLAASNGVGISWAPSSASFHTPTAEGVLDVAIASSGDDAEQAQSGRMESPVALNSPKLDLVYDPTGTPVRSNQVVGLRFTGVGIPSGMTVLEAWIQFTAAEAGGDDGLLTVQAQAHTTPPPFVFLTSNISSRTRTTNSVAWAPAPWRVAGEAGPPERTPSLRGMVQEVIDRQFWVEGNPLVFIVSGTGRRVAESFDTPGGHPARLHLSWTPTPYPAAWVSKYFKAPGGAEADPGGDPDQDGLSNLAEYLIGSDPIHPDDLLEVRARGAEAGFVEVSFTMTPALGAEYGGRKRVYDLQRSLGAVGGDWVGVLGETSLMAAPGRHVARVPVDAGASFYRVRVRLE
ncbi:MAG TPA: hypothetical protein DCM86_13840 [Verrucomicrobiales bacterium]|nr:hypothetical protein [Verrucomicrobiales bacterium]